LLLLQVLASCLWLGHSEVGTSFANCPQFFYKETFPNDVLQPQNPAWICQCYSNTYQFATLYDQDRRIPVYSAYIYQPESGTRPDPGWFVEPQLIDTNDLKEMEKESYLIEHYNFTIDQIKQSQAVLEDYENLIDLDRAHLNPSGHQDRRESKTATFTLTNIVPMDNSLYIGHWNSYQFTTMQEKSKGCTTTYIITGAVPGNTEAVKGRVNRPSYIWSAACCLVNTQPRKAWGAIAENDNNKIKNLSLGELEATLTEIYGGRTVSLFNNSCPRQ
ncbi:ENDD1 protein, partial [Locustella ochotensis]|nr:ENDD1 protein [Locustella ochotensis]